MVEMGDIIELKRQAQNLLLRVEQLKAENAALCAENLSLRAKDTELVRRLGLTPSNSHKSPSSAGYGKKPALPKPPGGKVGGQPGHTGKTQQAHWLAPYEQLCQQGLAQEPPPQTPPPEQGPQPAQPAGRTPAGRAGIRLSAGRSLH